MTLSTDTLAAIQLLLDEQGIRYREVHHEPTDTSEAAAAARGEKLEIGGKAIVMKVGSQFKLFVVSAALKVDSVSIKKKFKAKKLRFATKEELFDLADLVPGSVPPFGPPITPFELHVDRSIVDNSTIAFNAGSLTDSVIMDVADYLQVAEPQIGDFSA